MTGVIVKIDYENNAEEFWNAFRERFPVLRDSDLELWEICNRVNREQDVEIVDAAVMQRFFDFVESLPGYADGPEFAKTALIVEQVE